jgi:hypothetical protein
MPGRWMSQLVIFTKISAAHLQSRPRFLVSGSCIARLVRYPDVAWHSMVGTVLSPPRDRVITGCGSKGNCLDRFTRECNHLLGAWLRDYAEQSMMHNSYKCHAQWLKLPKVGGRGIPHFEYSITQVMSMDTRKLWTNYIFIFYTLLVFIESMTSSGNTLSAMAIAFCSLMNCIISS